MSEYAFLAGGFVAGWLARGAIDDLLFKIALRIMGSAIGKTKIRQALAKMSDAALNESPQP